QARRPIFPVPGEKPVGRCCGRANPGGRWDPGRDGRTPMNRRVVLGLGCLAVVAAVGWLSVARPDAPKLTRWEEVGGGVYRTKTAPHGYAIVSAKRAVLIDATVPPDAVRELGVETVEAVVLTHHHRDAAAFAADYRKAAVPVRAAKE